MNKLLKKAARELGSRGGKKTAKIHGSAHYRHIQKLAAKKRVENRLSKVDKSA